MSVHVQNSRMTTAKLRQMKANGEKIAMLTSYDFTLARLVDEAGIDMLRETLDDILGHRPDPELSRAIKATVVEDPLVLGAYDLLIETYGPDLTVAAIHVEVPDTTSAAQIDEMTRRLQLIVMQRHGVALATVGIYALNTTDDKITAMRSDVTEIVMGHEGVLQMHGFYVNEEQRCIVFDVILDFALVDRQALRDHIVSDIQKLYPDYTVAVTLDRDLSD